MQLKRASKQKKQGLYSKKVSDFFHILKHLKSKKDVAVDDEEIPSDTDESIAR